MVRWASCSAMPECILRRRAPHGVHVCAAVVRVCCVLTRSVSTSLLELLLPSCVHISVTGASYYRTPVRRCPVSCAGGELKVSKYSYRHLHRSHSRDLTAVRSDMDSVALIKGMCCPSCASHHRRKDDLAKRELTAERSQIALRRLQFAPWLAPSPCCPPPSWAWHDSGGRCHGPSEGRRARVDPSLPG